VSFQRSLRASSRERLISTSGRKRGVMIRMAMAMRGKVVVSVTPRQIRAVI
jgi:hypothetical protein